jgi:hypothetical protein
MDVVLNRLYSLIYCGVGSFVKNFLEKSSFDKNPYFTYKWAWVVL